MSRLVKIAVGFMIAFFIVIVIGFIGERMERETDSSFYPVGNSSTSFCIIKDGKPYYFAVEGWEQPTREEIESILRTCGTISDSEGLHVWLKVRTNLNLTIDTDVNAYVLVGDIYKCVFDADTRLPLIKRGNDVFLIPYRFWLSREDIEALLKAEKVRLYFDTYGYDILPTEGCIEGVCFTSGYQGSGFYVNFTPVLTLRYFYSF